ncbi:CBS domain-containing protein [uncultured Paraglaciecola sp.]|uniref:CBS domain-containing protein n=1 Tax=uncultured Paraglaciecola sp. TaxID=1765024 RepID=UPI00261E10F0|nr:CBS domain-containing protein [uncultured Paraglaciecola sp.]
MQIEKIMSKTVVTVSMDDTLSVVKHIFENAKFHHLLVVENGRLQGVISDRDLLKSISPFIGTVQEKASDTFTLNRKVHQIMSRQPITLTSNADVYEAISLFNQHNISCIPVVNENGAAVGVLSWRDILKVIEVNHNNKLKQAK